MSEGALNSEQVTLQNGLWGMVTGSNQMLDADYSNFLWTT
jgi:hypothetical protein